MTKKSKKKPPAYERKALEKIWNVLQEIEVALKQHTDADAKFAVTVSTLLDLTAQASELFERSKADQKRQLINFALSNLTLRGKKLHFTLKKPFDAIVRAHERSDWLRGQDSNLDTEVQSLQSYR